MATPSAPGGVSVERTSSQGTFPLSAELGLTPEDENGNVPEGPGTENNDEARQRQAKQSAPVTRSAQGSRGRPRREDDEDQ